NVLFTTDWTNAARCSHRVPEHRDFFYGHLLAQSHYLLRHESKNNGRRSPASKTYRSPLGTCSCCSGDRFDLPRTNSNSLHSVHAGHYRVTRDRGVRKLGPARTTES